MNRRRFIATSASTATLVTAFPAGAQTQPRSEEFLRAVREGAFDQVRSMLLADDSLVYARDAEGRSAFVLAHLHNQERVARHLSEQGFLMDAVEATLDRDWERIDEIGTASPGAFSIDHPIGGNAVYAGALFGLGRDIWRVHQYAGDPNSNPRGEEGVTPARAAVDFPDPIIAFETTASLLGNGGDANAPQRGRSSVLHGAAAAGNLDLIRFVVRKGGDPTAQDAAGRTPEHVAASLGHDEAAALLKDHAQIARDHRTSRFAYRADGSAYEAPPLDGYAPKLVNDVVSAAHFDPEATASFTRRFPEMAFAVSYFDEGAIEAGAHTGNQEVVRLLLDVGAPYSLPTAAALGDVTWAAKLLAEDPLRVNERGAHDFALMWFPAIGSNHMELAELFLDSGTDVGQEHMGTTALHWAARAGRADLARLLLTKGADPDAVGRKFATVGETPLDYAISREDSAMVQLLEDAGATRRVATSE